MKLEINFVVGLLTNLRWNWLNFICPVNFLRGWVRSTVIFMRRGEGESRPPLKKMTSFMNSPLG